VAGNQDARKVGSISVDGVNRTHRVVEQVERSVLGGGGPARRPETWTPGILRARVSTAIPGGTWDAPSSAGRVVLLAKGAAGWEESDRGPIQVYNDHDFASPVAVGKAVKVAWIAGELWLIQADCP
jgi:hypothetical protein